MSGFGADSSDQVRYREEDVERRRSIHAGGSELSYWETLLVILRRWRISVPAVLMAAGVGAGVFFVVPPSYEDTVQVLFLGSPNQPGEKAKVNPYLGLSSTLVQTAAVVQARLSTPQEVDSLAAQGATALYLVAPDQSTPAPVLIVTTTSAEPATAARTTKAVVEEIKRVLVELQQAAGAPTDTWVTSSVISSLPAPERKLNASLRPAITAAGGFFILTMFVLFLIEGRQRRRVQEVTAQPAADPLNLFQADPPPPSTIAGPPQLLPQIQTLHQPPPSPTTQPIPKPSDRPESSQPGSAERLQRPATGPIRQVPQLSGISPRTRTGPVGPGGSVTEKQSRDEGRAWDSPEPPEPR
jgi:capsular polysaccharide biosynthesis protein